MIMIAAMPWEVASPKPKPVSNSTAKKKIKKKG
jgi:hypothetical protein